jgi:hypothetical protein
MVNFRYNKSAVNFALKVRPNGFDQLSLMIAPLVAPSGG